MKRTPEQIATEILEYFNPGFKVCSDGQTTHRTTHGTRPVAGMRRDLASLLKDPEPEVKIIDIIGLELFGHDDQPTTCPECGARTDFQELPIKNEVILHECLNEDCKMRFLTELDD
jgi:hypothetical protein